VLPAEWWDLSAPPRGASEAEKLVYETTSFNQRVRWRLVVGQAGARCRRRHPVALSVLRGLEPQTTQVRVVRLHDTGTGKSWQVNIACHQLP
jgi:hypothetical protein